MPIVANATITFIFTMNQPNEPTTPPHASAQSNLVNDSPSPTLVELERESWQRLTSAIEQDKTSSAHPSEGAGFKTMMLATCTPNGADARMVVLRQVDEIHKYVWFHTDARARKVIQLEAFPNATLLLWDDTLQVQLRLTIETRLHTDDYIADEHWERLWAGGRKTYLAEHTPGSKQHEPYPGFPPHLGISIPSEAESEAGRINFAVIECRVLVMEYLHLSRQGQTRAQFQYEPDQKMVWLAP